MTSRRKFLANAGIAGAVAASTVAKSSLAGIPEIVLQDTAETMPPLVPPFAVADEQRC